MCIGISIALLKQVKTVSALNAGGITFWLALNWSIRTKFKITQPNTLSIMQRQACSRQSSLHVVAYLQTIILIIIWPKVETTFQESEFQRRIFSFPGTLNTYNQWLLTTGNRLITAEKRCFFRISEDSNFKQIHIKTQLQYPTETDAQVSSFKMTWWTFLILL